MGQQKWQIKHYIMIAIPIFLFILIGSMFFLFLQSVGGIKRNFTSEAWKKCPVEKRYKYIESLEEQFDLLSMHRSEVEELLGLPPHVEEEGGAITAFEYRIADDIMVGWKVYRIGFSEDKVIYTDVMSEDW